MQDAVEDKNQFITWMQMPLGARPGVIADEGRGRAILAVSAIEPEDVSVRSS
jgi:hypothetical protein